MKRLRIFALLFPVFLFSLVAITYSATVTKEKKEQVKTETSWAPANKICNETCEYEATEWRDRCPHEGEYQVRTCKTHSMKQKRYRFDLDERSEQKE